MMRPLTLPGRVRHAALNAIESELPDVIWPAAIDLHRVRTEIELIRLIERIPERVLPLVADYAASRTTLEPWIPAMLLQATGYKRLNRAVGQNRASSLMNAYGLPTPIMIPE
jgi:hypothetical protein